MRFRVSSANHYTIGPRTLAAKGRGRFTLSGVPSDVEVCSSPTEHGGEFSLLRCPAWGVAPLFKTRDSTAYAGSLWSPRPSEGQTSEYAREGTEGTASHSTVAWSPLGSQTLATEPNTEQHPLHYKVSLVGKKWYILDLCVSSLRRGHANLLCIVPIFTDDPEGFHVECLIFIYI